MVRFGYDGSGFSGWARQPGLRTLEGTIRDGLGKRGVAPTPRAAELEVASRTDRGVSARGNVVALSSELSPSSLLRRLNSISPELFFTAAAPVPRAFRVRAARRRVYRYFEPGPLSSSELRIRAACLFAGRVDVRSFGRGIGAREPVWRTVDFVSVRPLEGGAMVEVQAPSFVWGMVRKIVGALREVDHGRLALSELEAAIAGRRRLTLPLAEPEGLVLWEVDYPSVRWEVEWAGPNRHQRTFLLRAGHELWRRRAVLSTLPAGGAARS